MGELRLPGNVTTHLQRERAHDLVAEIAPLLAQHHAEVAAFDLKLEPNIPAYCAMEDAGGLRCFTLREGGLLIGYVVHFVVPNPHYVSSKQATADTIFVSPEYRDRGRGLALLRYADEQLAQEGVQVVYQHTSMARDFGPVLTRFLGYRPIATVYGKRLAA